MYSFNYSWKDGAREYDSCVSTTSSGEDGQPKAMTYSAADRYNPEFGEEVSGYKASDSSEDAKSAHTIIRKII